MKIRTDLKSGRWYRVQYGDTLSGLAQRFYGNAGLWPQIYNYRNNRTIIGPNPDLLRAGISIELW